MEPIHPSTKSIPDNVFKPFWVLIAYKNTLLPFVFLWFSTGALYGALNVYLVRKFGLEPFEIPDATLLFFLMTFYAGAALQYMKQQLKKLRSVQGANHNIFFKIRSYLDDSDADQTQVFAIRDLIIASELAVLGPIAGLELEALALARVIALLPDDLPDKEKEFLNKLGKNENPMGAQASNRMLLIASQRFNAAMPGEGFSQVQQRLEIENLLLLVRGVLGGLSDDADDGAVHIAYSQILSVLVVCYLIIYPWSLDLDFGNWTVLSTAAQFLYLGSAYGIAGEMFMPYSGIVKINMRSFFVEIEAGFPRWAKHD
jgi:hypothetical protein